MEYTKGEWKSERRELAYGVKVGDDFIATVHNSINAKANAQLISKAPKMYELIKYLAENGWNAGVSEDAKKIVGELKALAKAEGE